MFASLRRVVGDATPGLRPKLLGLFALLLASTLLLWGLTLATASRYPALLAFAVAAYLLGLRHAVDADHIAAIDTVTRQLLQQRQRPLAVGFFFSLGHSTVVVLIALLLGLGAQALSGSLSDPHSTLAATAALLGSGVSAFFLLGMALLNLLLLAQLLRAFRQVRRGGVLDAAQLDATLKQRGFFARLFGGLFKSIDASWKMYPIGLLFGLGFDTATEIGLFVLAATVGSLQLPLAGALLLPLLFTAGMCLADTSDGVLMLGAYGWAFVKPQRQLFYNLALTLITALVALLIGALEVMGLLGAQFHLGGPLWDVVGAVAEHSGYVGAGIIAIFVLSWLLAMLLYRLNRYDEIQVACADRPPISAV